MPCPAPTYTGSRQDDFQWANWSGRVRRRLASLFTPTSASVAAPLPPADGLPQLVKVVREATLAGKSLHAIGSGWAFDDQAVGDDWTIDISQLRSRLTQMVGEAIVQRSPAGQQAVGAALTDEWRGRQADRQGSRKLVHVEAGIKLWQLVNLLDGLGLALPTLGGATGQSLAGVINTSVHGGDRLQPAFPGLVRAIHLVTEGGREVWLEPARAPITTDARLRPTFSCADTEILRDDEVFDAALVGLGRFGVVYAYVLEVRPQFRVAEVAAKFPLAQVLAALNSGLTNSAEPFASLLALAGTAPAPPSIQEAQSGRMPDFFQLVASSRNSNGIWVQRRWESTNPVTLNEVTAACPVGDLAVGALQALLAVTPGVIDDIAGNTAFDAVMGQSKAEGRRGRHAWITAGSPTGAALGYTGVSVEVMFDSNDPAFVQFLEFALTQGGSLQQLGWVSLRTTASTRATLSMHNVRSRYAVSIEIALLGGKPDNESFLNLLQQRAIQLGGRLHWGQANNLLTRNIVGARYGEDLRRWRLALRRISGNGRVFSNAFTQKRGLEPTFELEARVTSATPIPLDQTVSISVSATDIVSRVPVVGAPVTVNGIRKGVTGTAFNMKFKTEYLKKFLIDPRTHQRVATFQLKLPSIAVEAPGYARCAVPATFTGEAPPPDLN